MENNEHRLVPGQARPPNLGKLKRLAQAKPAASDRSATANPSAATKTTAAPARPRRFRRAGPAWAGALTLASVIMAVASLVVLDRSGFLRSLGHGAPALSLPDAALPVEDRERLWALAEYEPARFAALLGAPPAGPARLEEDARQPGRLLSDRPLRP